MSATTYRVLLRERPQHYPGRGEWRLLVRSTNLKVPPSTRSYSIFVDGLARPDLDLRCLGISLGFDRTQETMLLVETLPRRRPRVVGSTTNQVPYANAVLVLPDKAAGLDNDDIWSVWAEWRATLARFPELTSLEGAETIVSLLSGIVDGLTVDAVEALLNANHAPTGA